MVNSIITKTKKGEYIMDLLNNFFHFKSLFHELYFCFSVLAIVLALIHGLFYKRLFFLKMVGVIFLINSIIATFVVIAKIKHGFISIDCVWYNLLIGTICLIVSKYLFQVLNYFRKSICKSALKIYYKTEINEK